MYVLPVNFSEFCLLMKSLDSFTQYDSKAATNQYEKFKWKHRFDVYLEELPTYYNDYFNACLKFIDGRLRARHNISDKLSNIGTILLPNTEKVYATDNRMLNEMVKQVRSYQLDLEKRDEDRFQRSKADHERYHVIKSFEDRDLQIQLHCCDNVKQKMRPKA